MSQTNATNGTDGTTISASSASTRAVDLRSHVVVPANDTCPQPRAERPCSARAAGLGQAQALRV